MEPDPNGSDSEARPPTQHCTGPLWPNGVKGFGENPANFRHAAVGFELDLFGYSFGAGGKIRQTFVTPQ